MSEQSSLVYEDPIFTGQTLLDFSILIDVENPNSTNVERSRAQIETLRRLDHHFDIRSVQTTPDKNETALIIEEAMGDEAYDSVVWNRTGDGGNRGSIRAAMGRGAVLWQSNAGKANNLNRASFNVWDRNHPHRILEKAKVARTRPLEVNVTDPDGKSIYSEFLTDEFGLGNMANAQMVREAKEHRDYIKKASLLRSLLKDASVGAAAIDASPAFRIIRSGEDQEEQYNELTYSNIGHIALLGRIRDSHMTDRKLVEITDSYRTKLGPRLFYAKLYSYGISGTDVPDGQSIEFDMVTDANAQGSGDPFAVPAGSHVSVKRADKELFVVTTRKRP